jgi:hypothetical protein
LSTIVLNERTKFLEKLAESENIKVKKLFCWKCFLWRVCFCKFLVDLASESVNSVTLNF